MKKLLLFALVATVFQSAAQSHKPSAPVRKVASRSATKKPHAPSPLTLALVEMKEVFKDKIAERNDFVTAFVLQAYRPKVQHLYELEEMLDKVPTDKESRDMLLSALAQRSGREEMVIEQLYVLGVSTANARLIAAYTINLMNQERSAGSLESSNSGKKPYKMGSAAGGEAPAETRVATEPVTEQVVESKVYTYVEQMPQLPGGGGNAAIIAAIQKATRYPALALRNQVEGRVFVNFQVDENGVVSAIRVVKGLGSGLDEETVRAVSTLPRFVPGRQNGQPVSVSFTVPITWAIQ